MNSLQSNTDNTKMAETHWQNEGIELIRIKVMMEGVELIGYDPLFGILEMQMTDGTVWWFYDVPDFIWYQWRQAEDGLAYFHKYITGRYLGQQIAKGQ